MTTIPNPRLQHLLAPTRVPARLGASFIEAKPIAQGMAPQRLETRRLVLRALSADDRAAFVRAVEQSRPDLEGVVPVARPGQDASAVFDQQLQLTAEGDRRCVAWRRVAVTPDGRFVGAVAIREIQRGLTQRADAVWWIARDARRQGFGVEMVGAAIKAAFDDLPNGLGLDSLTAMIQPDNAASKRLARAIGFRHTPAYDGDVEMGGARTPHEGWTLSAARVIAA